MQIGQESIDLPDFVPSGGLASLQQILSNALTFFLVLGGILVVIVIVWSGIQWITSTGDKQKVAAARGRLTWAIVGYIIMMLGVAILQAVGYFFQVNVLQLTGA